MGPKRVTKEPKKTTKAQPAKKKAGTDVSYSDSPNSSQNSSN